MTLPDQTQEMQSLANNLIQTCNMEIHDLTELKQHISGIKSRLDKGTQPTLNEIGLMLKMDEYAKQHESVLKAIRIEQK